MKQKNQSTNYDYILSDARVVDGGARPAYHADVAILEEAVHRMTGLSTQQFGIKNRD